MLLHVDHCGADSEHLLISMRLRFMRIFFLGNGSIGYVNVEC